MSEKITVTIVGGGLAGCEAAWQVASRGIQVKLYEMRPAVTTGAHISDRLAELVCSNSLGSQLVTRATGLLLDEISALGSLLAEIARKNQLPAGGALAVDRVGFSNAVTQAISSHPNITVMRQEVITIPDLPAIICSGPLTSPSLSSAIQALSGVDSLFFYDAIAPIVEMETINMDICFKASRYGRGSQEEGDYINCPFTKEQYNHFVEQLAAAERIPLRTFESQLQTGVSAGNGNFFEGCLPIEVLANRGLNTLAFGPMRPVGIIDHKTDKRPYAVVQLRQDNIHGSLYNLVGFQTNLTYQEQDRVLRLIPGLEGVRFARYGQMHRNTYLSTPLLLDSTMMFKTHPGLFFAGQITGVEGYLGNIASGLLAGWNAALWAEGKPLINMPEVTMLGTLCHYITHADPGHFQPMKANFGLFDLQGEQFQSRSEKVKLIIDKSRGAIDQLLNENPKMF
jgi:methylenetetrahydrofolate--tRNA-(uracil-5-)-methyltransferase